MLGHDDGSSAASRSMWWSRQARRVSVTFSDTGDEVKLDFTNRSLHPDPNPPSSTTKHPHIHPYPKTKTPQIPRLTSYLTSNPSNKYARHAIHIRIVHDRIVVSNVRNCRADEE